MDHRQSNSGDDSRTRYFRYMLLRRTAAVITSLLLLQSTIAAAAGSACLAGPSMTHATSTEMNHAMTGMPDASMAATGTRITHAVNAPALSSSGTSACIMMNACTSVSSIVRGPDDIRPGSRVSDVIVLFGSTPVSRVTTPDVPPPRA